MQADMMIPPPPPPLGMYGKYSMQAKQAKQKKPTKPTKPKSTPAAKTMPVENESVSERAARLKARKAAYNASYHERKKRAALDASLNKDANEKQTKLTRSYTRKQTNEKPTEQEEKAPEPERAVISVCAPVDKEAQSPVNELPSETNSMHSLFGDYTWSVPQADEASNDSIVNAEDVLFEDVHPEPERLTPFLTPKKRLQSSFFYGCDATKQPYHSMEFKSIPALDLTCSEVAEVETPTLRKCLVENVAEQPVKVCSKEDLVKHLIETRYAYRQLDEFFAKYQPHEICNELNMPALWKMALDAGNLNVFVFDVHRIICKLEAMEATSVDYFEHPAIAFKQVVGDILLVTNDLQDIFHVDCDDDVQLVDLVNAWSGTEPIWSYPYPCVPIVEWKETV